MSVARAWLLVGTLLACAAPAEAQLGEVQLGGVIAYGTGKAYGRGAGLVFGVSAGRLGYVALRWTAHQGTTSAAGPAAPTTQVRTRAQVAALDLGVVMPAGMFEIVPGFSLGAVWFQQRAVQGAAGSGTGVHLSDAVEFLFAPGLSVEIHAAGVVLIPQLQYYLAGHPDVTWPAQNRGKLASLRLVVPIEVHRIRR